MFCEKINFLEIGSARIFIQFFKSFPERLSIAAALYIFIITFNNFNIKPSTTI